MICKIIKLVTGETVAGNVVEETSHYIDVMRPVRIIVAPKSTNSVSVLFARWDHTSDFDLPIRIFKSGLVSVGEPMRDFTESYEEMYYELDRKNEKPSLTFDDEDEEDDLSNELEEIVNNLQKMTSNTNNKTYH